MIGFKWLFYLRNARNVRRTQENVTRRGSVGQRNAGKGFPPLGGNPPVTPRPGGFWGRGTFVDGNGRPFADANGKPFVIGKFYTTETSFNFGAYLLSEIQTVHVRDGITTLAPVFYLYTAHRHMTMDPARARLATKREIIFTFLELALGPRNTKPAAYFNIDRLVNRPIFEGIDYEERYQKLKKAFVEAIFSEQEPQNG